MRDVKMVAVIATEQGYDGLVVRQPGEEFYMPETMFAKTERLGADKKHDGTYYDPPSWFKRKSSEREKAVRLREQARSAAIVAEAAPENRTLKVKAADLNDEATVSEAKADALDVAADAGSDLA